ncbi:efflux RND transporter periplasmic adaptor subunit [Nitratireductor mangrovi]|uniref:Efflux RND transporter periplasmic adaptor subunit n=1 Tax=Nitratireductor mangrovi TaxID=2599600 RepID=A0A5B8KTR1_9HYPH|nr:efflux RND transporter periplasmic adaptor subunit [Nitratireductor mangrovi]QDY98929.1 efflux RND transporter periplasmic adaptor subunit [Nitratireductor mangrovi]
MWRRLLFFPPVIAAAALVYWAANQRQPPATHDLAETVRDVRTIVAGEIDLVPRVTGFGTVNPGKTWKAVVQVPGEVTYVHPDLKRGRILAEGTEIIRISPSDTEIAIARAQANISRVEAQLAELDANESNLSATLEIEEEVLAIRQRESERRQRLGESGTVSATALDQDARETLAQRKKVQDIRNTLKLVPAQRRALEEQKKLNELELAQAELNLERTRISLPFDARIAEVSAEMTQFAQTGSTLVTADGIATSEVEAQIPISEFAKLARVATPDNQAGSAITTTDIREIIDRMGFSVTIKLDVDSVAVEWPARVSRLSDTVDLKTRSVGVIVTADDTWRNAIPGERPPLSKGLFVGVELRARKLENRIVVPRSALHDGHVYVVDEEERLKIVPVDTGLWQESIVVIREGLAAGDRVVVSDLLPAIEGMRLRPARDAGLEAQLAREALGEAADAQL